MAREFVIGMDLGGTNLRVAAIDREGGVSALRREETAAREGPAAVNRAHRRRRARGRRRHPGRRGERARHDARRTGDHRRRRGGDCLLAEPSGMAGRAAAPPGRRGRRHAGAPGEGRERSGVRRVLARRRPGVLEPGAPDPRHRGRRRAGARRRAVARRRRHGGGGRSHHRRSRRGGAGSLGAIPEGTVKLSGRVQNLFEDTTLLDKGANLTESGLKITITGSAYSIVEFEVPELFYEWSSPDVPGPQGLMVDMAFQGFYDNHAEASAIVARVTNTVASY